MYKINKKNIKRSYFLLNVFCGKKRNKKDYTKLVEKILLLVVYYSYAQTGWERLQR